MPITEHSMSVDDFLTPKVYENVEAVMKLLTRLLILEPGTLRSHPDAGVGLYSKYAYSADENVAAKLQDSFQKQIQVYLPTLQGAQVSVRQREQYLLISVEFNSILYGIMYNTTEGKLDTTYTKLSDL